MSSERRARAGGGWALLGAAGLLLGACATRQGEVVLLPEPGGQDTAVSVWQDQRQLLLDKPYAGATLTTRGPQPQAISAQQVDARYGATLSALPLPPVQFILHFIDGRDELTDESRLQVDGVFQEIVKRPLPDVILIGHTDTVGNDAANDALSRQRAEVVRAALVQRGLPPHPVVTVWRGKRELSVLTADGVTEPRNRRVEVLVR